MNDIHTYCYCDYCGKAVRDSRHTDAECRANCAKNLKQLTALYAFLEIIVSDRTNRNDTWETATELLALRDDAL